MNLARRGILKLISAAPALAAAAPALATQAAGYAVPGLAAGLSREAAFPGNVPDGPRMLTSLVSFLKEKEIQWREQSRNVSAVDPDIALMRLPLTTKVRMQADRNFERIKSRESTWFTDVLAREGQVKVW